MTDMKKPKRKKKTRRTKRDPLVAAYMARDGLSEKEAKLLVKAVRGMLAP